MITKNQIRTVLTLAVAAMAIFATSAQAALIDGVNKIGIDFGPTTTANWNNITANGTIADGSVVATNGEILTGISITTANGSFWNNDGPDNWVGLASNGGSAPADFLESVTTDIAGRGGADPYLVTVAGLNDSVSYDVVAVCTSIAPYANAETLTINDGVSQTVTRDDTRDNGTFHSFTGVATDGSGNLELAFTNPENNPVVCGVLIIALDPNLPSVDAGGNMITWSGQEVQLDPTVVNNDSEVPQRTLSYLWTAEPVDGVVFSPSAIVEAPSATITKTTDNPSPVTLTLAVTLEGKNPISNSMVIDVYDDACQAAKAVPSVELDSTDIDANCITNLADLAVMAETWLEEYSLTEPALKP